MIRGKYEGWILGSIRRTYAATKDCGNDCTPLAAFILTSCAIDFFAGFFCGIESFDSKGKSGDNYKAFVKKYMTDYDPEDVYKNIRCRLAHNYTVGGDLELTNGNPMSHDPAGLKGTKIINFENFFEDFRSAADKYFEDLESSLDLQGKFNKRFPLGFADVP